MPERSKIRGRLFGAALLLVTLAAGGWWWHSNPKIAAEVGKSRISEQDIAYRIGVEQAYGSSLGRPGALEALIADALQREVGRSVGVVVTDKELDEFSASVDRNSKAPAILKAIKQVFGSNVAAYRRLWLAPKLMNHKLHDWFGRDATMQAKQREAILMAYAMAREGKDLRQVAKATGLRFAEQHYTAGRTKATGALKAYFPEGMATMSPGFRQMLDALKPGEMAGSIAEDDASYRIVRLVGRQGDSYNTQEIIVAKRPFDPWFQAQRKKIPVRIDDRSLRAEVVQAFPGMTFASKH